MDCMEGMETFPDKYFDLAIVDPPYGLSKNLLIPGSDISSTGVKRRQKEQHIEKLTQNKPHAKYFEELKRISKNQVIWGVNHYEYYLGPGRLIWKKNNPVLSHAELAYHSFGVGVYIFEYTWSGFCQANMKNKERRIHPTQKPVQLYKWILHNYAKPDFKILDTHAGSCSSVIAFLDYGCDWTAFEIDKDYYKSANKRIKNHKKQLRLSYPDDIDIK